MNFAEEFWLIKVILRHFSMTVVDILGLVDTVDMVDIMDMVDTENMVDIGKINMQKTFCVKAKHLLKHTG